MARKTDPIKYAAKSTLRRMRADGVMETRRQQKIAFDIMFADMAADAIEGASQEQLDAIVAMGVVSETGAIESINSISK